ncbi:hypothetical protein HA402_013478 [Bradysia odoriphaga]|nr:hypothetical protein HA402_013478 [Bradysia odoriphaga]
METNLTHGEAIPQPPPRKWKQILRQNSDRIGAFAEDAVLPMNQRSTHNNVPGRDDDIELDNVRCARKKVFVKIKQIYFPFFMIVISVIQVGIMYLSDHKEMTLLFGYDPHRRHEVWRFFTDAFVHTGPSHLWSNMLLQIILGVLLEIVHHCKRIAVIYFASVLGGSLFVTILSPGTYVIGASAGIYGLLFSHLSTIILNWNEMDWKACRLFWLILYIVVNFSLGLVDTNNSLAGHFGGAVTGFLVSILVLKSFEKHPWEKKMQKICLTVLIALFVVIIVINVTASGLYLPTEWNFNYTATYEDFIANLVVASAEGSTVRSSVNMTSDA